jgi:hypothetical protein
VQQNRKAQKRAKSIVRVFTKSQRESQFGRAFIGMFTEARQSAAAFERVRKTLVFFF